MSHAVHHAWTVLDSVEVDFMFTHYLLGCGTDKTTKQQVPLFSGNLSLSLCLLLPPLQMLVCSGMAVEW